MDRATDHETGRATAARRIASRRRAQAGYSLAEMLTVVAIIGAISLVTIPSFMTYYRTAKLKTSLRNLTSDIRKVRALAIGNGVQYKLSYTPGTGSRRYDWQRGDKAFQSTTWTAVTGTAAKPSHYLDEIVYFPKDATATPQNFTDVDSPADKALDIVFSPDGTANLPTGVNPGIVTNKTDASVPQPIFQINISPSGRVLAK